MEPETPEFDPLEAPEHIRGLARSCVEYVQRATGVVLDFTPDTLPLLDHYLQGVRDSKEDVKRLVSQSAGAYFGEVARRLYPSRWHAPEGDIGAWRVEFSQCFLHFNPVAFAREAVDGVDIGDGASFGVNHEDLEALQAGLSVYGEVPEEDYYLLGTRLEVLGPIVDRLVASAVAREEGDLEYGPGVYRHALDDEGSPPS